MSTLGPYLVIVAGLVVMLIRANREQRVRPGRMWIVPVLGIVALVTNLSRESSTGVLALAIFAVALAAGVAAGWFRALHTQLTIDPATKEVTSKPTLVGAFLIIGFVALRVVLDTLSGQPPGAVTEAARNKDVLHLADVGLIFSLAMIVVRRLVIWRRAHALIAAHAAVAIPPSNLSSPASVRAHRSHAREGDPGS